MLWYLLYPVRGTSQPPRLSASHPVRRAFYRHGKTTAQHWLVAMLVSVAVAMAASYPTVFLRDGSTTGFTAYPHHVWASAKSFDGDPARTDVEMRQIWIYGDHMGALNKAVLKDALSIQQTLVGNDEVDGIVPTWSQQLRDSTLTWGYHSPLMYWNNSAAAIDADEDLARTINEKSRSSSSLNVGLRPASVFAGKVFDRRDLRAADALIITLMNKVPVDDGIGRKWDGRMQSLANGECENCTLYPNNGHITRNRIYEFSFIPLSTRENALLTFAYSCMALYVLLSLRRLRAFHSRFGLVVTAITQMTWSVLASFTICGLLKINLSTIPQNAYPFVVLVIGLENMFRLINAILAYPATIATDERIANALGDVGPVSVAAAAQNLLVLSTLSRFVSPGVAAFCYFACIATLFDVFFLLTFFVAVLNVDIRRLELQDALHRSHHTTHRRRRPSPTRSKRRTWFDALVQGRLPFSTRMAGTAVTTTFILSLNYHFFENHDRVTTLRNIFGLARGGTGVEMHDTFTPPPMNASLSAGDWMRMQDFDTAKEVMRLAKPGADSFVIRIFAPLVVVLANADRSGGVDEAKPWTHALGSFATSHFYPVVVLVVFAVAFVSVLMSFLLYNEGRGDIEYDSDRLDDDMAAQSVALPHELDIVRIAGTPTGHFATIGLDKSIAVSTYDRSRQAYSVIQLPPEVLSVVHWPIFTMTLDERSEWLACHCANDQIMAYNCASGELLDYALLYPDDSHAVLFRFVRLSCDEVMQQHLLILTYDGSLTMRNMHTGQATTSVLHKGPIRGAVLIESNTTSRRLYVITEDMQVVGYESSGSQWTEKERRHIELLADEMTSAVNIAMNNELGPDILIVTSHSAVMFLDRRTPEVTTKLDLSAVNASGCGVLLGSITSCPACNNPALQAIGLYANSLEERDCSITTLSPGPDHAGVLCLRCSTASCRSFGGAAVTKHRILAAGAWRALDSQDILGIRRRKSHPSSSPPARSWPRNRLRAASDLVDTHDMWEAYKFSLSGNIDTTDILPSSDTDNLGVEALYVTTAGPTASLDSQSIAVVLGNTVKVVRASRRGPIAMRSGNAPQERSAVGSKRRATLRKAL